MKRRDFLKHTGLASTALLTPSFLLNTASCKGKNEDSNADSTTESGASERSGGGKREGKILVVVQLSGGNDGLNTFIPHSNDIYFRERPEIAVPRNEIIRLNDNMGLNPVLQALQPLYDKGLMSVVNNVGYPNSNRSHFKSMDIWHSAAMSGPARDSGWLGRYLDSNCAGCELPYTGVEIDDTLSLAMRGEKRNGFCLSGAEMLRNFSIKEQPSVLDARAALAQNSTLAFLNKVKTDTNTSASFLAQKMRGAAPNNSYPATNLGQQMKLVAQLITADSPTQIYYVTLSGFDTHDRQVGQHSRVLKEYGDAMAAFVTDLEGHRLMEDTLVMTFSEFGRRVKENGGKGTDHGKANNVVFFGKKLAQPGFMNGLPDLQNLDEGDVPISLDFRQLYSTILDKWLNADSKLVLGERFQAFNFL